MQVCLLPEPHSAVSRLILRRFLRSRRKRRSFPAGSSRRTRRSFGPPPRGSWLCRPSLSRSRPPHAAPQPLPRAHAGAGAAVAIVVVFIYPSPIGRSHRRQAAAAAWQERQRPRQRQRQRRPQEASRRGRAGRSTVVVVGRPLLLAAAGGIRAGGPVVRDELAHGHTHRPRALEPRAAVPGGAFPPHGVRPPAPAAHEPLATLVTGVVTCGGVPGRRRRRARHPRPRGGLQRRAAARVPRERRQHPLEPVPRAVIADAQATAL